MNPPWQPPDPKRFRPNEPSNDRQWAPPPHHAINHQPHVHPSRQSQLPPPPPIAPYHQQQQQQQHLPPPPQPAPYYNPPQQQPTAPQPLHHQPPPPPPHHHHHYNSHNQPPPHSQPSHSSHSRRNKSSDPRQRHQHPLSHHHNIYNPPHHHHNIHAHSSSMVPSKMDNNNNNMNSLSTSMDDSSSILDVLHIGADDTKNFGSFAVTLNQIYGSRNIDGLPFGSSSSTSIQFDGRIRSSPILSFVPEAIDTPSKKVRVYELSPLAATDKPSYDELVAFFTKQERCPVVDKEYNMGILLYFVPPKLIFKKVDPTLNGKDDKKKRKRKHSKKDEQINKTNFVELLKLSSDKVKDNKLWMISITSTSKYLMFKQKIKDKQTQKQNEKKDKKMKNKKDKKKKKLNEADLSDIEISTDDDDDDDTESDQGDTDRDGDDDDDGDINGNKKNKYDDVPKSELIIALEALYSHIGQKLPD